MTQFMKALEVPANAELDDAALQHRRRQQPRASVRARIGRVLGKHRVRVERVVDVEVRVQRVLRTELEDLAEPDVELVQAIAKQAAKQRRARARAGCARKRD